MTIGEASVNYQDAVLKHKHIQDEAEQLRKRSETVQMNLKESERNVAATLNRLNAAIRGEKPV